MLLSEIFNSEKSDQRWTEILQSIIDKHGLKKFNGNNATVITSEDRKHVYRIWAKDPGFEKWIEVALTMQNNPHVVKILGKIRTIDTQFRGMPKDVKLKILKLEKLESLSSNEILEAFVFRLTEVINNWDLNERESNTLDSFIEKIESDSKEYDASSIFEQITKLTKTHKGFLQTILELSRKGYNDFSIDNIMLRGNVPVIVDPLGAGPIIRKA